MQDPLGFLGAPTGSLGFQQLLWDSYGFLGIAEVSKGSRGVFTDSRAFRWIPKGSNVFQRMLLDSCGFLGIPRESLGIPRVSQVF